MKTTIINQILETQHDPTPFISYHLNNIAYPILKSSEKSIMSDDAKTVMTTTELFCTKCNEHFVKHGEKCSNPVCPNCGNEENSYFPSVDTSINDDTYFSDDIDIVVESDINRANLFRANIANICVGKNSFSTNRPNMSTNEISILFQEQVDGETILVMRHYVMYFRFDIEKHKREIVLVPTGNALLFGEKEVIVIRDGKRSTASVRTTTNHYYYQKTNIFLTTHDLYVELHNRLEEYYPSFNGDALSNTNLLDVYAYSPRLLDTILGYLRSNKPVSQRTLKQDAFVDGIVNSLPELEPFSVKTDKVFYTVIEKDELLRICKFKFTCPHCKKTATGKMPYQYYVNNGATDSAVCPHCGESIDKSQLYDIASVQNKGFMFNVVQDYEDGLLIRDAKYVCKVADGECIYTPAPDAPSNLFIVKKDMHQDSLMKDVTIIRRGKKYAISKSIKTAYNNLYETKNFATNLNIKWAGLDIFDEAHGRDGSNIDYLAAYILLYRKFPVIEKLLKEGYSMLLADIIHCFDFASSTLNNCHYDLSQKETHKALRMSKGCLRILKLQDNFNSFNFEQLQALYLADENITAEDYHYMLSNAISIPKIVDIAKEFGFTIHQICEYIERVRVSQCVPPHLATSEWYDYLVASKIIGCDLTDKRVKYPVALRTEHDKVVYKKSIIENKNYEEAFSLVTKQYGEKFSYKSDDFVITYPKTLSDLFEEGRMLNHCVGTYGDAVKNGKSIILFARKAKAPDMPYFTIEVNPSYNAITQFCGFADASPNRNKHKDLIDFVKKWAVKNNIFYN